jgi:hypothetical protein
MIIDMIIDHKQIQYKIDCTKFKNLIEAALIQKNWSLIYFFRLRINQRRIYNSSRACPNIVPSFLAQLASACSASSRRASCGMSATQLYPNHLRASPAVVAALMT